jgi:hypothetical protein
LDVAAARVDLQDVADESVDLKTLGVNCVIIDEDEDEDEDEAEVVGLLLNSVFEEAAMWIPEEDVGAAEEEEVEWELLAGLFGSADHTTSSGGQCGDGDIDLLPLDQGQDLSIISCPLPILSQSPPLSSMRTGSYAGKMTRLLTWKRSWSTFMVKMARKRRR